MGELLQCVYKRSRVCLASLAAASFCLVTANAQSPERHVAATLDDLPTVNVIAADDAGHRRVTTDLLTALTKRHIPAIGFVNENKLFDCGKLLEARVELLQ